MTTCVLAAGAVWLSWWGEPRGAVRMQADADVQLRTQQLHTSHTDGIPGVCMHAVRIAYLMCACMQPASCTAVQYRLNWSPHLHLPPGALVMQGATYARHYLLMEARPQLHAPLPCQHRSINACITAAVT